MKRERSSDDKFLALLARMPGPMDLNEICDELAWSRQRGAQVAHRLVKDRKVIQVEGRRNGHIGRPSLSFVLPGALPPSGAPQRAQLEPNTYVLTPTGQEARVIGMRGRAFAEFEYVTGPERFQRGTLHISLLRPFQPGRARPAPVRIAVKVEA